MGRLTVFLTGATGVIGSRVVSLLVAAGQRVTAVGRTPEKRADLERAGATAIDVDLFDPAAVRRVVAGHDVVINLATHIPPSRRAFFPAWLGAGVGVPRVLHFVGIARRRRRGRCGGARCTRGDLQRLR